MSAPGSGRVAFTATDAHKGMTVQKALHERTGLSNAAVKGLLSAGGVRVNGRDVSKPDHRLAPGDKIDARWDPDRKYRAVPASRRRGPGFLIVHEDDDVVVVDKEAGVLTVPTPDHRGESVAEHLEEIYRRRGFRNANAAAVHRIDRYTSGLVAFARNGAARAVLRREFAANRPERVYLAAVEGVMDTESGRLEHRLVENAKSLKVAVARVPHEGKRSVCRYRVIEAFPHATLVEVRLETGRRNQIRVQFAATGHPLIGDVAYGRASTLLDRTALHAHRLAFETPSKRRLALTSPPPRDFKALLTALRLGADPAESSIDDEDEDSIQPKQGPDRRAGASRRERPTPRAKGRRYR